MAEFTWTGKIDSKGRITVPVRIRNRLNLEPGDQISLEIDSAGIVKKKFSNKKEALNYLSGIENVKSFSFDGKVLEVILSD